MYKDFDDVDFNKPVLLHKKNEKFWEISVEGIKTIIRCGILVNGEEIEFKQENKDYEHTHKSMYELYSYLQKSIDKKIHKGYKIMRKNKRHLTKDNFAVADDEEETEQPVLKKKQLDNNQQKIVSPNKQQYQIKIFPTNNDDDEQEEDKQNINKKQQKQDELQIKVLKPDEEVNQEQLQEKNKNNNKLILKPVKDINKFLKIEKADYSDTSRKTSLTDLTDISIATKSQKSDNDDDNNNNDELADIPYYDYKLGPSSYNVFNCLLAQTYEEDTIDPKGWYISEKLDGVRGLWNGHNMHSRNQKQFFLPDFFTKNWPKSQLDGELWLGRNRFQECISIVKRHEPQEDKWKNITYLVYDAPGLNLPFNKRIKIIEEELAKCGNQYIKCHQHILCEGKEHLKQELDKVIQKSGEGIMLRNPKSFYEGRRSETLLKVKSYQDEECTVIGYEQGEGRCSGMVGALVVRNDERGQFKIGSGLNDQLRKNPPKKGTKVTYKYWGLTNDGKPRFPIFVRVYIEE